MTREGCAGAASKGEEAAAAYEQEKRDIAAGKIPAPQPKPEKKKVVKKKEPKEKATASKKKEPKEKTPSTKKKKKVF